MQLDVNLQLICNFDQNLFHAVQISLKELSHPPKEEINPGLISGR